MVTYTQLPDLFLDKTVLINIAAALLICPSFFFSAHAGRLADTMDKAKIIQRLKLLELCIMVTAAFAIYFQSYPVMLVLIFLMGTQTAYFGPVKYSLLPRALKPNELVSGNAWVETGTFLAILAGTLLAGAIVKTGQIPLYASIAIISFATLGFIASLNIGSIPPINTGEQPKFNFFKDTWKTLSRTKANKPVWMAVLAISWFWFLGAVYLTQLSEFTLEGLYADPSVFSLLLALFSIGIAVGSLLCERFSFKQVELGFLPFGIIGLSFFSLNMVSNAALIQPLASGQLYQFTNFVSDSVHWRFMFDLFMMGVSGGIFTVPLYAFVQSRTEKDECAKAIATNNIMNSLFMIGSSLVGIIVLDVAGLSISQLFWGLGVVNLIVALYVYSQVPEFTMRFVSYLLSHIMYRLTIKGRNFIPKEGAAVLVCNHVSYTDALILMGASTRPVRFVMDKSISEIPVLKYLFRHVGVIPICSPRQDKDTYYKAFEDIHEAIADGDLICIFPEGRLTRDGEIGEFRPGIKKILDRDPVPVVPMALKGMWGSFFSHKGGHALTKKPRRFWSKLEVEISQPLAAETQTPKTLQEEVTRLFNNKIGKK